MISKIDDDPLTPEFLRLLALAYATILESVANTGVHGLDSVGLEKIRLELNIEKHHFLAVLSQLCSGRLIATDDDAKFFATEQTAAFAKVFRMKHKELSVVKVPHPS